MVQQIANNLTDLLLKKEIVKEEDKEIYTYGLEALLSTVINTILVLIFGLLTGMLLETLAFLISFAILRVYCGGYHAKTHVGCILMFAGIYGFAMLVLTIMPAQYQGIFSMVAGGLSLLIILLYAPIEHKNRPFVGNEYKTFRMLSRIIALLEAGLIVLSNIFAYQFIKLALNVSMAMLSVVFILALAKIIERKR